MSFLLLSDLLDIRDLQLLIEYLPHHTPRWIARITDAEVKDGCILASVAGRGALPSDAVIDYVRQIRGKRIVLNAMDDARRVEFTVPEHLTFNGHLDDVLEGG